MDKLENVFFIAFLAVGIVMVMEMRQWIAKQDEIASLHLKYIQDAGGPST